MRRISNTRIIALSFLLIIFLGTVLLMLPIATRSGESTGFLDALFTSTSATCVTGLVTYDTYTHWSLFGQLVILTMIQIGGIGLMTFVCLIALATRKQLGLKDRTLLMSSSGNMRIGGVVQLIKKIFVGTLLAESIGALFLSTQFIPKLGASEGIYFSIFHSISAFCNAGFDLMGKFQKFSSLTLWYNNEVVVLTIATLIIVGGIGFIVWNDIYKFRWRISKFSLHSKIVLSTTALLILIGFVGFLIFEANANLANMSVGDKLLSSFFMSVTPRTAGFNTVDLTNMSESSGILTSLLMLIGGSPGSTAGGLKTTTIAVCILWMYATARGNNSVTIFKRRLEDKRIIQAAVITSLYLLAVIFTTMIICHLEQTEGANTLNVLFETVSAIGTVGLSKGITPELCGASKVILAVLMYGGRLGGLSLLHTLAEKSRPEPPIVRPVEKIMIG